MARCKECMHYDVCSKEGRMVQVDEHTWDDYNQLDNVEVFCNNHLPAADVVPKSEVEKIFEGIERKIKALLTLHLEEINKEYIKDTPLYDRHAGIIFALQGMADFIAELKKKYTERTK